MVFDKIEIIYEKYCLPIKIKYSETRKPTFMEFLILSIILEYPNKEKSIADVLDRDFKILKQELFQKAFNDLVNFKLIKLIQNYAGWDTLKIETSLNKILVDDELKARFEKKEYWISQSNKNFDAKWIYDPLTNQYEIVKDTDWDKKINNSKTSSKLSLSHLGSNYYTETFIDENTKKFIDNNQEIFGEKATVTAIEITSGVSVKDLSIAQKQTVKVNCAIEAWIELESTGEFKIKTDEKNLEIYFAVNKIIQLKYLQKLLRSIQKNKKQVCSKSKTCKWKWVYKKPRINFRY
ncbi:hypothetical protein SCLARK_001724 [Spiroplasma clarkii]|uniref:hypothetical protein n=1 Tax=Spiroplasma clarkii TaxID=2139 RepID=UPI000B582AC7|nr:hypothetical protein [Spiroplasma clarkii]ARU92182.1 hypothetical protein SCLARK_001724 [Spiroplasma clarkii]